LSPLALCCQLAAVACLLFRSNHALTAPSSDCPRQNAGNAGPGTIYELWSAKQGVILFFRGVAAWRKSEFDTIAPLKLALHGNVRLRCVGVTGALVKPPAKGSCAGMKH